MKGIERILAVAICGILFCTSSIAEETAPEAASGDPDKTTEQAVPPAEAVPPEPPETSRKRRISSALSEFKPSEEISADNAVPFPVDI